MGLEITTIHEVKYYVQATGDDNTAGHLSNAIAPAETSINLAILVILTTMKVLSFKLGKA